MVERLIRHTGRSGHGSDVNGPKWEAQPRPENLAEKKFFYAVTTSCCGDIQVFTVRSSGKLTRVLKYSSN